MPAPRFVRRRQVVTLLGASLLTMFLCGGVGYAFLSWSGVLTVALTIGLLSGAYVASAVVARFIRNRATRGTLPDASKRVENDRCDI